MPGYLQRDRLLYDAALWRWRLTTLDRICLGVVSYIGCLWFGDLHLAILLRFSEREVLLIPLQTTQRIKRSARTQMRAPRAELTAGQCDGPVARSSRYLWAWNWNATWEAGEGEE